jgi:hypothetical protein
MQFDTHGKRDPNEHKWRLLLKILDKGYKAFVAASPEALANILKLCCAFCKVNGGGEDWLQIVEEAEETLRAVC